MFVEGALTHPCHSFAVGKPAIVLVRVQGATLKLISSFGHFGHVLTCGRRLPASAKLPSLGQRLNFLSALNHDLCQLVNAVLSISFTQPMRIGDASDLVFLLVSSNQRKSSPLGCPRPRFSQDIRSLPAASAKVAEYSHDISENWGAYSSKATLSTAGV